MAQGSQGVDVEAQMKKVFKQFDVDDDNTIDPENLLLNLSDPGLKTMDLSINEHGVPDYNSLMHKITKGLNIN